MDLRKDLELIEVNYSDDKEKVTFTFLDIENGQVLEVNFNKQVWQDGEYVPNEEKAAQVEEWCQEYFGTSFNDLTSVLGAKKDIYVYEKFNSLWETTYTEKFKLEDKGRIFESTIDEIEDDGVAIRIRYQKEGSTYESKMTYAKYIEHLKQWMIDPQRKEKQHQKFKEKYGVTVEESEKIIGKKIMVEVKVAFSKFAYGDIKKPDWA